jgi:hypothetical protein
MQYFFHLKNIYVTYETHFGKEIDINEKIYKV